MKIYEPSSFWFSALGFESLCKEEEEEKKMIEDAFPRLPVSSFFVPVIPQNVPVYQSRACGASEGRVREGGIMRAHAAREKFRHPLRDFPL